MLLIELCINDNLFSLLGGKKKSICKFKLYTLNHCNIFLHLIYKKRKIYLRKCDSRTQSHRRNRSFLQKNILKKHNKENFD